MTPGFETSFASSVPTTSKRLGKTRILRELSFWPTIALLLSLGHSLWQPFTYSRGRHNSDQAAVIVRHRGPASFTQQPSSSTQTILVPAGSTWKYLDNGSAPGTTWRSSGFDDTAWSSGAALLGYGDEEVRTVVGYGSDAKSKHISTYFRHSFNSANASRYKNLTLRLRRDDGAVVYLNGKEVLRSNMPAGAISYTTLASSRIDDSEEESTFYKSFIDPRLLLNGTNVLAVEVHQASVSSSDVRFDLELIGSDSVQASTVTRGPYLQTGTPASMVVRWRSDVTTDSRVRYGTSRGKLTLKADNLTPTYDHEVALTGLFPDTKYYYSIGTTTTTQNRTDGNHSFVTSPLPGTAKPTRIWVIGDSGTADAKAQAVRDAYYNFTGTRGTDVWLMLGDNAYPNGRDSQYQAAVFDIYSTLLRTTVLWPTFGNHDSYGGAESSTAFGPYYNIFTLPRNAEAGGTPSGKEAYYSFDYSNIHFICLNSVDIGRSSGGTMLTWLERDLAATSQQWIIAFWHHPPYSKGSYDSDKDSSSGEMSEMRKNVLPILEAGGVDLVLAGHSHVYERSYLLDGHYGKSNTLTEAMKKDTRNGREDADGAYEKKFGPHEGTVYIVVGCSGEIVGGPLNHPVMSTSLAVLGSLILDIKGERLDAVFIDDRGVKRDYFTILKRQRSHPPTSITKPVDETS